jgi:hypothetical protein
LQERTCPFCHAAVVPVRQANGLLGCPRCRNRGRPPGPRRAPPGGLRTAVALLLVLSLAGLAAVAGMMAFGYVSDEQLPGFRSLGPDTAPPHDPAPAVDGAYLRSYAWDYGGLTWTFELRIPDEVYARFHGAERPVRNFDEDGVRVRQMAYDIFVTTPDDDAYIDELAARLQEAADEEGWSTDETLSFALAFVQSLTYTQDAVTAGYDEYPRYPLETLVDEGGDCEDTSILYASLVQALGYGAVLLSPPAHMGVGVAAQVSDGRTIMVGSQPYLYAETTGHGWRIGEVPDEYAGTEMEVFDLVPQPLFTLDVEYGAVEGGIQALTLTAHAVGSADATGIEMFAGIAAADGRYLDSDKCPVGAMVPGDSAQCTLHLDLRTVPFGKEVEIHSQVQDAKYYYARVTSAPYTRH